MKHNTRGLFALAFVALSALGQIAVRQQGFVPFSDEPIHYLSDNLSDPVAKLQQRLARGQAHLEYEPKNGYLKSLLDALGIPASSQTLVFSKTSFQFRKISPKSPRALYFNDDVYVGWVQDGKALEIASFDPMQGAIFYLLDGQKVDNPAPKRAELDCTQCHIAKSTHDVPGVMLRSIYARPSGVQAGDTESYITGHESPLRDRWGGWYVTGTHGSQSHMGNAFVQNREHPEQIDRAGGANLLNLSKFLDTSPYLTPHSDIVAHLVLAHQTQMHNLITLTNYQARLALHAAKGGELSAAGRQQYETPAEELLRYLLFTNEAPLEGRITGTSGFAEEFAAHGPRDDKGRSLRDFDLRTRIFKYPCSYLIYSADFAAIPEPTKSYIYHRLLEVLTGRERRSEFARLSAADRQAILEILLATKEDLPQEWRQYAKRNQSGEHKVQAASNHGRPQMKTHQ